MMNREPTIPALNRILWADGLTAHQTDQDSRSCSDTCKMIDAAVVR